MKVSRAWLQKYFATELPSAEAIANALTFHAVEIEEVEGDTLEVKVLPDRAAYMLSHRGVALEVSASLDIPLKEDPLRRALDTLPETDLITVDIEDADTCPRYIGALVRGVKVGPSPAWLRKALESVGQRSINNVVDATNYVMLDIGQPLHAFDYAKTSGKLEVRLAREGEILGLLKTTIQVKGDMLASWNRTVHLGGRELIIADKEKGPLALAGLKGGKQAEVSDATVDILIESANFDGTTVRTLSQHLKTFTDASNRFQNKPSPALAAYGLQQVISLIQEVAGGELIGIKDSYVRREEPVAVSASTHDINGRLGSSYTKDEIAEAFKRLGFVYSIADDTFTIVPGFERRDLVIKEDLAEEVGRILGYENIPSVELSIQEVAADQARYRGIERVKDFLVERGYSEVSTQSFAKEGDIELANPLQDDRPWLRASLLLNLEDALMRAVLVAPRLVGPDKDIRLFEIGTVFTKDGEFLVLSLGAKPLAGKLTPDLVKDHVATLEQELFAMPGLARFSADGTMAELNLSKTNLEKLGDDYAPAAVHLGAYRSFSSYPFALRDIAVWTPAGTEESEVANIVIARAGDLLARIDLFDRFEKEGRTSYAFRLVFESYERTLSDADLDPAMERITAALNAQDGYEVR